MDITDDPKLVREMALAGCTGVFIGFESLSDSNLADARKKTPRTDDYSRRVAMLHDHGIQVNGSFVVGFDEDRRDSFATLTGRRHIKFRRRLGQTRAPNFAPVGSTGTVVSAGV